ncbi:MAG: hypothetical protein FWE79_01680, partial [Firmicutes bacterium]|nr:hypothetical protein [Bacillota bacterium]
MSTKNLCNISESDLLAITTVITKEISKIVKDIDTLDLVADIVSTVGASLTMLAGQRDRCAK